MIIYPNLAYPVMLQDTEDPLWHPRRLFKKRISDKDTLLIELTNSTIDPTVAPRTYIMVET